MRFPRAGWWVLLVFWLAVLSIAARAAEPFEPIRVVLVRHAEKAKVPEGNVTLKPAGWERAGVLAEMLSEAGVTALYASEWRRTKLTLLPLSERLGLPVREISAKDPTGLVKAVLSHPGGLVVVAAHSDTLPALVEALGGGTVAPIDEGDYDNLFVLTIYAPGKAAVTRLRWSP